MMIRETIASWILVVLDIYFLIRAFSFHANLIGGRSNAKILLILLCAICKRLGLGYWNNLGINYLFAMGVGESFEGQCFGT